MSETEHASEATPPAGCQYACERSTSVVTLQPSLSDVKWDQIEAIGNSVEGRLTDDKPKKVVFDISGLTYMGSAMVALVVRWWKTVETTKGESIVACHDPNVLEVLKLASLDEHWTIVPTREAAFKKLGVAPIVADPTGGIERPAQDEAESGRDSSRGQWLVIVAAMGVSVSALNMIVGNGADQLEFKFLAGTGAAVAGVLILLLAGVVCGDRTRALARTLGFVVLLCGGIAIAMAKVPLVGPNTPFGAAAEPAGEPAAGMVGD